MPSKTNNTASNRVKAAGFKPVPKKKQAQPAPPQAEQPVDLSAAALEQKAVPAEVVEQKAPVQKAPVVPKLVLVDPEDDIAEPEPQFLRMTTEEFREQRAESFKKLEEEEEQRRMSMSPSVDVTESSTTMLKGVEEKVQVYYAQAKDGAVQIIGKVGDQLIIIKAKICEVGGVPAEKIQELYFTMGEAVTTCADKLDSKLNLSGKTAFLRDGYVHFTAMVDGQVVSIKGKASKLVEVGQTKAQASLEAFAATRTQVSAACVDKATAVHDYAVRKLSPGVVACRDSSCALLQPIKPYYLKVHNGIAHVVAIVNNKIVVFQVRVGEVYTSIEVKTLESVAGVRAAIEGYTSPLASRVSTLYGSSRTRVDHFVVSFKDGMVSFKGATGERIVYLQGKFSEAISPIQMKFSNGMQLGIQALEDTKKAVSDLTQKLASIVSASCGQTCDSVRTHCISFKQGILHVVFQVQERIIVLRIKVVEMVAPAMDAFTEACGAAKGRMLQATEAAKATSMELAAKGRSVAANPSVRVTAASAAGGAAALGATGATAGAVVGGAVALPAALFTFGLSIPLGAAVGACIGTAAGGATGLVSGGAAGYTAHKHKDKIGSGLNNVRSKAQVYKGIAADSTSRLRAKVVAHSGSTFA